ncbi:MAG: hypothetical protein U1F76_22110 [Candidatus Competibacteraceae bacterium]
MLAFSGINLEGNIIPRNWYFVIRLPSGKPDLVAMALLAEIVYWHRPVEVRDEETGELLYLNKKFKRDKFCSPVSFYVDKLGLTPDQVRKGLHRLEQAGLIEREYRDLMVNGAKVHNMMFVTPVAERILAITQAGSVSPAKVAARKARRESKAIREAEQAAVRENQAVVPERTALESDGPVLGSVAAAPERKGTASAPENAASAPPYGDTNKDADRDATREQRDAANAVSALALDSATDTTTAVTDSRTPETGKPAANEADNNERYEIRTLTFEAGFFGSPTPFSYDFRVKLTPEQPNSTDEQPTPVAPEPVTACHPETASVSGDKPTNDDVTPSHNESTIRAAVETAPLQPPVSAVSERQTVAATSPLPEPPPSLPDKPVQATPMAQVTAEIPVRTGQTVAPPPAPAHSPEPVKSSSNKIPPCPYDTLVDLYNDILHQQECAAGKPGLPEVLRLTGQRKRIINARWKEYPDLEFWRGFFEHVARSDYLMGRKRGKCFRANLDWLLTEHNFVRTAEGIYHD